MEAQSWTSFVQGHKVCWWSQSQLGLANLSALSLRPGILYWLQGDGLLFFPEWTHSPPSGGTRRPYLSGRHADQTRCHSGCHHPGKAAHLCLCPHEPPHPFHPWAPQSCPAPVIPMPQSWLVPEALKPHGHSGPSFPATSWGWQ